MLDITLGILNKLLNLLAELSEVLGNYGNKEMSDLDKIKKDHKSNQKSSDEVIQHVPEKKRKRILYLYPLFNHKNKTNNSANVSVDFYHRDGYKIYNVQAKEDDYITGEVGKIDTETGETPQVSEAEGGSF